MNKFKIRCKLLSLVVFAASVLLISGCRPDSTDRRVYFIAIDGLRPDKLAQAQTPNLDAMINYGAFTDSCSATIPTQTRVNFVTIPTGVHADRHLVVGSIYRDRDWRFLRTDGPTMEQAQKDVDAKWNQLEALAQG